MLHSHRTIFWHPAGMVLACALLAACASRPQRSGHPDTNKPKWQQYGENSAYADFDQGQIYKEALGGEAIIISPQWIVP